MRFPTFHEWTQNRVVCTTVAEAKKAQSPNYSFDNFVRSAEKLKGDVDSMVGQAKNKEVEVDRDVKSKKNEPKPSGEEEYEDDTENKSNEDAWKSLRKLHKDRAPDFEKKLAKQSAKPPSSSKK